MTADAKSKSAWLSSALVTQGILQSLAEHSSEQLSNLKFPPTSWYVTDSHSPHESRQFFFASPCPEPFSHRSSDRSATHPQSLLSTSFRRHVTLSSQTVGGIVGGSAGQPHATAHSSDTRRPLKSVIAQRVLGDSATQSQFCSGLSLANLYFVLSGHVALQCFVASFEQRFSDFWATHAQVFCGFSLNHVASSQQLPTQTGSFVGASHALQETLHSALALPLSHRTSVFLAIHEQSRLLSKKRSHDVESSHVVGESVVGVSVGASVGASVGTGRGSGPSSMPASLSIHARWSATDA
mmetsp:Transcript_29969/g.89687  ORF Transcript_29969/g.89687 Transcript_29969/m.89687 type:complete len:296 (-) Transcript_29969:327-1214(-)